MTYNIPKINYTLHHDICTGFGICEGACASGAINAIVKIDGAVVTKFDAENPLLANSFFAKIQGKYPLNKNSTFFLLRYFVRQLFYNGIAG